MIGLALLIGLSLSLGGFLIRVLPNSVAGIESSNLDNSAQIKKYIKLKSWMLYITGGLIIIGGLCAQITGINKIFELSVFIPSSVTIIAFIYGNYKVSNQKKFFFKINKKKVYILLVMFSLFSMMFLYFTKDTKITIQEKCVIISGLYGGTIPVGEIQSIKLLDRLPTIDMRTNGFAFGYNLVGHFQVKGIGAANMFIHSSGQLVEIRTSSKYYFINFKDSIKTDKLYKEILSLTK